MKQSFINFAVIMWIQLRKSKTHRATLTDANLNYEGSITIDEDLLEAANILPGERLQIVNNNNGERLETYAIKGERGTGTICLNGAAARRAEVGDIVIIISYAYMEPEEAVGYKPTIIHVDQNNKII